MNELAKYEPENITAALTLAKILVASRLLPKGIDTQEQAIAIMITGNELGLTCMQSIRSIHIINGKPTLSADIMLGLVKKSPLCERFQLIESTDKVATYTTQRRGEEPTTMSFTIEQAKRAQLLGNPTWGKYPEAMLRARCVASLARAVYPDIVAGIYAPEEFDDHPAPQRIEVQPAPNRAVVQYDQDGVVRELPAKPIPIAPASAPLPTVDVTPILDAIDNALDDAALTAARDLATAKKAHMTKEQRNELVEAVKRAQVRIAAFGSRPSQDAAQ